MSAKIMKISVLAVLVIAGLGIGYGASVFLSDTEPLSPDPSVAGELSSDTLAQEKVIDPIQEEREQESKKVAAYETRKDDWMKARGLTEAVEINSFHALYPDEFRAILVNFIMSYFDESLRDEINDFNEEQTGNIEELISNDEEINRLLDEFLTMLKDAIDVVDWDEKEGEYDTDFQDMIDNHGEFDYSKRDDHYQWLLDTELGYGEQLTRYTEYEKGELDNPEEENGG